jgi:hypothetical protein
MLRAEAKLERSRLHAAKLFGWHLIWCELITEPENVKSMQM